MNLDHIALIVSDMETSRDFYVRFLGLSVKREFELSEEESQTLFQVASPAKAVQLLMEGGMVELFEFRKGIDLKTGPSPLTNGLFHYAIQLGRPIETFIAQAREENIPVFSIVRGGKTIYFIQDPDGVFIEVKE
ncbi:MAG: hypothetical protein DSY91_06145 [Deltaproteobacteria bacterium]|nr:MAG: hypothetical protein DSY91_06145 [Deltaproteobacteria bacterium]